MEVENNSNEINLLSLDNAIKNPDFFYPDNYKEKKIVDKDVPSNLIQFQNFIGFDSKRRYNLHFLSPNEIIYANGNTFQILNLETLERRIFQGFEYGGVGCIAVHPSRNYFAVGGCGDYPNIHIYHYPSLRLYRVLRRGTEKTFACLAFNGKGDQLASVGSEPDYNLVIWNWMNEIIILKSKAFSQEIFKVVFSTNFEEKLITSGIGHIK
jgi:WD40 repeat protein